MVFKIVLKEGIFEPIATFFTLIINDIEVWLKKTTQVFGSFYMSLPLTIETKTDNSRVSLCLI